MSWLLFLWEDWSCGRLIPWEGWFQGRADALGGPIPWEGWSPGRADLLGGLIPWEDWRASWCSSPIQLLIMVNRRVDSDKQNSVCTIMPLLFSWFLAYTRFKFAQKRSKIFFPCGIFCLFVNDIPPPFTFGLNPSISIHFLTLVTFLAKPLPPKSDMIYGQSLILGTLVQGFFCILSRHGLLQKKPEWSGSECCLAYTYVLVHIPTTDGSTFLQLKMAGAGIPGAKCKI